MNAPIEAKEFPLVQLANVLEPIERATGLGNAFYTDDQYYKQERDTLLGKDWVCIGFADDVKAKSFAKPVDFMGLPLLMMRNREGVLQVFHNVCSHRGMKLVHEAGEIQGVIRCGYHSWTYDLNGVLKGTPHVGGVNQHKDPRFACEKHGLKALRSHVWMGMVFVNLSGTAPAFEEAIKPLTDRWQQFLGADGLSMIRMPHDSGSWSLEVNCNWKLAVENYCEAYHLPWVHPSLNTYSRLEDHYNIAFSERFTSSEESPAVGLGLLGMKERGNHCTNPDRARFSGRRVLGRRGFFLKVCEPRAAIAPSRRRLAGSWQRHRTLRGEQLISKAVCRFHDGSRRRPAVSSEG